MAVSICKNAWKLVMDSMRTLVCLLRGFMCSDRKSVSFIP